VINHQGLAGQKTGTQDRQCRVLCARNGNFTDEGPSARDPKPIHV